MRLGHKQIGHFAGIIRHHYETVEADLGMRSGFKGERASLGGSFSREDIMDEDWRARMKEHNKVIAALGELDKIDSHALWLACGGKPWPEDWVQLFWWKPLAEAQHGEGQPCSLAGVVLATRTAYHGAKLMGQVANDNKGGKRPATPEDWLRDMLRRKLKVPIEFAEREAKDWFIYALVQFREAYEGQAA